MRNPKLLQEEPAWKKRRRELRSLERKAKLWKALWVFLGLVAAAFVITFSARGLLPRHNRQRAKPLKGEPALARVVAKRVETKDGKTRRIVSFRFGRWRVPKVVDQAAYNSLEVGREFLITYTTDPDTAEMNVVRWEVPKLVGSSPPKKAAPQTDKPR